MNASISLSGFLAFVFLFGITSEAGAQYFERELISNSGDLYIQPSNSFEGSMGEIMTEIYRKSQNQLTQGYHQSFLWPSYINDFGTSGSWTVFPNPCTNHLYIENKSPIFSPANHSFISLYNSLGQVMTTDIIDHSQPFSMDMSRLATGNYYITIINDQKSKTFNFHVVKM